MIAGLQALIVPLVAMVEARLTLAASLAIRRAALTIAATLFGVGALMFLSLGVFFGLMPGLGAAAAALLLALIWALLAGLCYVLSLLRPRRLAATPAALPPAVAAPVRSAVATASPARVAAPGAAPPPPRPDLAAQVSRAAPFLALASLVAGIVAGRR